MLGSALILAIWILFFYLTGDVLGLTAKSVCFAITLYGALLYVRPQVQEVAAEDEQAALPWHEHESATVSPNSSPTRASAKPAADNVIPSGKVTFYQAEGHVISHLLSDVYGLACKIRYGDADSIVRTHNFIAYKLTLTGALSFNELVKATGSLGQDINRLHRHYQYGEVRVLAVNHQPPILQVTRAMPERLAWAMRPADLDSLQTCIGEYMQGMRSRPLVIDLGGRNSPYVVGAFIGASRSGKSAALHVALCQLLENSGPDDLEVYGIDTTAADTFRQYANVPHFKAVASDMHQAMEIVEQFNAWCVTGQAPDDEKVRLLVIDECQELLADTRHGDAFLEKLLKVAGVGGKLRLRVWAVTQNPDARSYPEVLKGKTHFWAYTHMLHDRYLTKTLGLYGARELTPQSGDLIFKGPFEDGRVTTYWLDDAERKNTIGAIVRKWNKANVKVNRATAQPSPVTQNPSEPLPVAVEFPIPHRPPTPHEAEAIVSLARSDDVTYRGVLSMNRLIERVWSGKKNSEKLLWIKEVLDLGGVQYSVKE